MLQSFTECYRVLQSITEYNRVLQNITEYYTVLQSISSASTWTNFWACFQNVGGFMSALFSFLLNKHRMQNEESEIQGVFDN